jgi:hypothetical protein
LAAGFAGAAGLAGAAGFLFSPAADRLLHPSKSASEVAAKPHLQIFENCFICIN